MFPLFYCHCILFILKINKFKLAENGCRLYAAVQNTNMFPNITITQFFPHPFTEQWKYCTEKYYSFHVLVLLLNMPILSIPANNSLSRRQSWRRTEGIIENHATSSERKYFLNFANHTTAKLVDFPRGNRLKFIFK